MSPVILLSIVLQIACCVHVVRTGRPLYWVFILLVFSYLAVLVYVIAEILPDLRHNPSARRTIRSVRDRIDPERDKRDAARLLQAVDTPENRRRLAEESLRRSDYAHAAELYQQSLKGLYATDPDLMLGLAKAQFGLGQAQQTRDTLDALISANPNFRSSDGHFAVRGGGRRHGRHRHRAERIRGRGAGLSGRRGARPLCAVAQA
jgi:hypothetical protein